LLKKRKMEKFKALKLSEGILKAIEELGFKEPSEIQEKAIPLVLEGKDILGSSATGSGKTLAFGAGIIEKVARGRGVQALIMTPTRELAQQVASALRRFSRHYGLNIKEVYGGVSIEPQIRELETADVVVGTPGRLLDHLERRTLDLRKVRFLVLDEADRMLEMGFIEDVESIINRCPKERQTLLFSATISPDIERIAKRYMINPVNVEVESYVDASKLNQRFYDVPNHLKFSLLVHLLRNEKAGLIMVFCNTRQNTDLIARNLQRHEIDALAIHGGLTQNRRNDIMKSFNSGKALILVCTDVAARGLDIKGISHVYNYDSPKTSTEYIHRIGRTARAGKEGIAITLVSARDYENFRRVLEDDSLKLQQEQLPENMQILEANFRDFRREKRFGGFRGRGERSSGRGRSGDRGHGSHRRSFSGRQRSYSSGSRGRGSFRRRY
jgi:ATP-dependent RNA helicase DeaD